MTEVTVTKEHYEGLLERDLWLLCLEDAGVDNWQGISFAHELHEEYLKEKGKESA